jgi:hypothetical protein
MIDLLAGFSTFMDASGRITRLPAKLSKKNQLCLQLLQLFEFERTYSDAEVRDLLLRYVDDFAFVRRTLVDTGYMDRDRYCLEYRRIK